MIRTRLTGGARWLERSPAGQLPLGAASASGSLGGTVTRLDPHRVYVEGPTHWSGAEVICPPALRPAVVVLLAMLAAKGTSVLRNVYVINRGYEQLADRLNQLGAEITTFRDI